MVQITKTGRCFCGAGLIGLAFISATLGNAQPSGGQQVTLGWTASPDPTVVGYYLYYGTASGDYTNRINVGTNTEFTVSGLVAGTTYYFSETSYNAGSIESSYVPQISYLVPETLTLTQNPTNGAMLVQFPVVSGQSYQLQASSNLISWSNVWSTSTETTNEWIEYDEPVTNTVSTRFYRLIHSSP
jgi:Fibronectin type III domain